MKILIADDHAIMRDGIAMLLTEAYQSAKITGVPDSAALLELVKKQKWDVIITDISMPPGESGLEAVKIIREMAPLTPVLVLSMHPADQYAIRAIKAGASGYLTKSGAPMELIKAVNCVIAGEKYLSPEVAHLLAEACQENDKSPKLENLSNREFQVYQKLAEAKTINDIAKDLNLSANSVSTFRTRIFTKMRFLNNLELIRYALDYNRM